MRARNEDLSLPHLSALDGFVSGLPELRDGLQGIHPPPFHQMQNVRCLCIFLERGPAAFAGFSDGLYLHTPKVTAGAHCCVQLVSIPPPGGREPLPVGRLVLSLVWKSAVFTVTAGPPPCL